MRMTAKRMRFNQREDRSARRPSDLKPIPQMKWRGLASARPLTAASRRFWRRKCLDNLARLPFENNVVAMVFPQSLVEVENGAAEVLLCAGSEEV